MSSVIALLTTELDIMEQFPIQKMVRTAHLGRWNTVYLVLHVVIHRLLRIIDRGVSIGHVDGKRVLTVMFLVATVCILSCTR